MKHTNNSKWFSKGKYTFFLCITTSFISLSQQSNNRFFSSGTEIIVNVLPENDIFFSHIFDKGSSIYSLAHLFQVNQSDIYKYNRIDPNLPISLGKIVKIPIATKKIIQLAPELLKNKAHIKLFYTVKPKETLYSISKRYFDADANYIKKYNNLIDNNVNADQKLFIGYLIYDQSTSNQPEIAVKTKNSVLSQKPKVEPVDNTDDDMSLNKPTTETKTINANLIGYRGNNIGNTSGLYILYNAAPVGTLVDVYFDMRNSSCKAKVIGRIPDGMYKSDADIVVSPMVLAHLGVLDQRFMLALKYEIQVQK